MITIHRIATLFATLGLSLGTACIPYTVGTTAQVTPLNSTEKTSSWYFIPNGITSADDSIRSPLAGTSTEWRHGVDMFSDVGVRVLPAGVEATYKRKLGTDSGHVNAASAVIGGIGIVNWGEHFLMDVMWVTSGKQGGAFTPYGGIKVMQTIPISPDAVKDNPTIGGFLGAEIGDSYFALRPELGVFYDHSALGIRKSNIIIVPALTLRRAAVREAPPVARLGAVPGPVPADRRGMAPQPVGVTGRPSFVPRPAGVTSRSVRR